MTATNHPDNDVSDPAAPPARKARTSSRTTRSARPATLDAVLAAAVDLARAAAQELAVADEVGEHLGAEVDGERLVTHSFRALAKGYRGWRWAVTVARAPRARVATVCEVVLLPGADAILAPTWLPWSDRLAPGDLAAGDVLPYRSDDPLLEPGYTVTGDDEADRLAIWELGLGRPRVLSPIGRDEAARRWYAGEHGPTSEVALEAPAACVSCGYLLLMAGALRQAFGVCGNEWSPSDGQVVSYDHGCGAHSETDVERSAIEALPPLILDESGAEAVSFERNPEPVAAIEAIEMVGEVAADQAVGSEAVGPEAGGDEHVQEPEVPSDSATP